MSVWCCTWTSVKHDDEQEQTQGHGPEGTKNEAGALGPLLPKWAVNTHKSPPSKRRQVLPVLPAGAASGLGHMLLGHKLPALEDAEHQMSDTSDARSSHPFGVPAHGVQRSLASQFGLRPFTVDALRDLHFPVFSPHNAPPASRSLPVAMLGVETVDEQHVVKPSPASADTDALQSCRPSGPSTNSRLTNNLVPLHVNAACKAYFGVSNAQDYAGVVRKLLARDPLLAFAVQKALRHLRTGECKHVMHVTPDPSGQSSTLFGIRLTPCLWEGTGQPCQPALVVEHNMPYNAAEVMPRLMRDYAVLSHVPGVLTLIDFQGKALYQNAASLAYMGDLLSIKHDYLTDGLLRVLFMYDLNCLESMLEEVLHGQEWQGVIQVPVSIRRLLAAQAERAAADGRATDEAGGQLGGAGDELLEVDFQIGNSFSTRGLADRHRKQLQKASAAAFLVNRGATGTPQVPGGPPTGPPSRNPSMHQHALAAAALPPTAGSPATSTQIPTLTPRQTNLALPGSGPDSFTAQGPTPSAPSGTDMPNQRRFMTLLDKTNSVPRSQHAHARGSVEGLHHCTSTAGSHEHSSIPAADTPVSTTDAPAMAVLSAGSTHDMSTRDGDAPGLEYGYGDEEEELYDEAAECYHEVHAIPLLDPVLDKQVIMLVQTDVTPRVELENKLADLTDAQLSMLEQLFPRHIIEYMLARVPTKGGRNLRDLANTHDQVMVLFCDVVGFTSMSKEVEPSQVMHFLNELYEVFDELVDEYDMYKLDTVGDCYIVVAGLIKEDQDGFVCVGDMDSEEVLHNAERIMEFAKAMLRDSRHVLMPHNAEPVQLRVGLHTGPLVSGLVGAKMPKFTLFGDTMNTASRMESTCKPGCIHASDTFAKLLPLEAWQSTGGVQVKGKGLMETFLHLLPDLEVLHTEQSSADAGVGGVLQSLTAALPPPSVSAARTSINHTYSMSRAVLLPATPSVHASMHDTSSSKGTAGHPLLTILTNILGGEEEGGGGGGPEGVAGAVRFGQMGVSTGRLRTHGGGITGPRASVDCDGNLLMETSGDVAGAPDGTGLDGTSRRRRPSEGFALHQPDFATSRAHRRSSHIYHRAGGVKRTQSMGSAAFRARLAASTAMAGGSGHTSDRDSSQSGASSTDMLPRQPALDRMSAVKQPASPLRHTTGSNQAGPSSRVNFDGVTPSSPHGLPVPGHTFMSDGVVLPTMQS